MAVLLVLYSAMQEKDRLPCLGRLSLLSRRRSIAFLVVFVVLTERSTRLSLALAHNLMRCSICLVCSVGQCRYMRACVPHWNAFADPVRSCPVEDADTIAMPICPH